MMNVAKDAKMRRFSQKLNGNFNSEAADDRGREVSTNFGQKLPVKMLQVKSHYGIKKLL